MESSDEEFYLINGTKETWFNVTEPDSMKTVIELTIIYSVIFIAGILGNSIVVIVIQRDRSMHTAVNLYIISLAISDLFLLVCGLPIYLFRLWHAQLYSLSENTLCLSLELIKVASLRAKVFTITALTVERFVAIILPFMSHMTSYTSSTKRYIKILWIISIVSTIPVAIQFNAVSYNKNGRNLSVCAVKDNRLYFGFTISNSMFFVLPMILITVLYVLIFIKLELLHKSRLVSKNSTEGNERPNETARSRNIAAQRRVITMFVAVALSFFICWAPFHVQIFIAIYAENIEHPTDALYTIYKVLTQVSSILYFLSTTINPFLYNVMLIKFRNGFKMTLFRWCCKVIPQLEDRSLMRSPQQHPERVEQTQRCYQMFFRTHTSRVCEPSSRAQSNNRPDFVLEIEMPDTGCEWRQHLPERRDRFASPQRVNSDTAV